MPKLAIRAPTGPELGRRRPEVLIHEHIHPGSVGSRIEIRILSQGRMVSSVKHQWVVFGERSRLESRAKQLLAGVRYSVGWQGRAVDRARLSTTTGRRDVCCVRVGGDILVGFARAISDGATNAYISTVAVLPAYQGQGIGRELIRRLTSGRQGIEFGLHARPAVKEFYLKCRFEHAEDMLRIPRRF